jgi:hypothetical protein
MTDTPLPVVSYEEYGDPLADSPSPSPSWLVSSIASFGWSIEKAMQATLQVTFSDAGYPKGARFPQIEGIEATRQLPTLATTLIPVEQLAFSRKDLRLDVEVSSVSERWAREWANSVVKMGTLEAVSLGQGFASDGGTVIDMGDTLLRASWWSEAASIPEVLASGAANPSDQLLTLAPSGSV